MITRSRIHQHHRKKKHNLEDAPSTNDTRSKKVRLDTNNSSHSNKNNPPVNTETDIDLYNFEDENFEMNEKDYQQLDEAEEAYKTNNSSTTTSSNTATTTNNAVDADTKNDTTQINQNVSNIFSQNNTLLTNIHDAKNSTGEQTGHFDPASNSFGHPTINSPPAINNATYIPPTPPSITPHPGHQHHTFANQQQHTPLPQPYDPNFMHFHPGYMWGPGQMYFNQTTPPPFQPNPYFQQQQNYMHQPVQPPFAQVNHDTATPSTPKINTTTSVPPQTQYGANTNPSHPATNNPQVSTTNNQATTNIPATTNATTTQEQNHTSVVTKPILKTSTLNKSPTNTAPSDTSVSTLNTDTTNQPHTSSLQQNALQNRWSANKDSQQKNKKLQKDITQADKELQKKQEEAKKATQAIADKRVLSTQNDKNTRRPYQYRPDWRPRGRNFHYRYSPRTRPYRRDNNKYNRR